MVKKNRRPPLILSTFKLPENQILRIKRAGLNIRVVQNKKLLHRQIPLASGLISLLSDTIDSTLLSQAHLLEVVGNYAVGVNNIDLDFCRKKNITVVNTPDVLTRATAELTVALLFACARRIPEGEELCRKNHFEGWKPDLLLGLELKNRQAVIVGQGRIGSEVASIFKSLKIKTQFITRHDSEISINQKLKKAQILSLHIPLNSQNKHWLSKKRLSLLPSDCIVLNTTRGPVVDEMALISALEKRQIHSAGLDVYEFEPRIPSKLRKLKNAVLLPHVGSATVETRAAMAQLVVDGVLGVLRGKRVWNAVK